MNKDSRTALDDFLSREPKIRKLALENAKQELPSSDATNFDSPQTDIKLEADALAARIRADADNTLHGLAQELAKHEAAIVSEEFRAGLNAEPSGCKTKVIELFTAARNNLAQLRESNLINQKYLEIFKRERNIRREPKHTLSKQAHYLWIAFYAIVEIIANIFFFNAGFSAFDAIAISILLAAINLLISVAAGNFARKVNSVGSERYLAYGVCGIWLIFVIWFNTATAVTRSVMVAGGDTATLAGAAGQAFLHDSWGIFVLSPPNIADLMSVLLWIAGAAVGAFAFFEGYRSEDSIPGYSEIADAAKRARSEYMEAELDLHTAVGNEIKEVQTRFDAYKQQFRNALAQFNANVVLINQAVSQARLDHEAVNTAFVQLVNAYREENCLRVSKPPAYFSIVPRLEQAPAGAPFNCSQDELELRSKALHDTANARQMELAAKKQEFTNDAAEFPQMVEQEFERADAKAKEALRTSVEFRVM